MLQVVLVMLLVAMLSLAALGTVTSETLPTAAERARIRTAAAAEAGLQAGLAVARAARTTLPGVGVVGEPSALPCATPQSPLTGSAGATDVPDEASAAQYATVVDYFVEDPTGRDDEWLAQNALPCTRGSGLARAPYFALVRSVGEVPSSGQLPQDWADRSLQVVYAFNRTDSGVAGGLVRYGSYSASADLCWAAPGTAPASGSTVTTQPCDDSDEGQQWAFRDDYSVVLAATQSAQTGAYDGMCLTAEPVHRADLSDWSGGGSTATASSGPDVVPDVDGPVQGSARTLSGNGSWLRTPFPFSPPGAVTVTAWFRTTSPSGTIIGFGGDAGTAGTSADRLLWVDAAGRLVWGVSPTSKRTVSSSAAYDDGRWHHAAASVGAAGMRLFVDGALVAGDPAWTSSGTSTGYWHLGWGGERAAGWLQAPANPYWAGGLAHVGVWNRQLSDAEVSGLATAGSWDASVSGALAAAPQAYWPLGGSWDDLEPFLAQCDGGAHQKWAYDDNSRIELERFDAASLSGLCVDLDPDTAGTALSVSGCGPAQDWAPSSDVGAGAAGETTSQLVNYGEYGRCLDITNQRTDWPYLIAYPCKADPTRPVLWNQRFVHDEVAGTLMTQAVSPSVPGSYCLTTAASDGGYVLAQPCAGTAAQRWVVHRATASRTTAYTIVDSNGRCLSLGPPGATSGGLSQWSTIVAERCDGSNVQKWNAPPQVAGATLTGHRETTLDSAED